MPKSNSFECTYCGELTSKLICVRFSSKDRDDVEKTHIPTCTECSKILKNIPFTSLDKQAAYIADILAEKNKKVLNSANWADDELAELDGMLRRKVKHLQSKKMELINRIRWANTISCLGKQVLEIVVSCISSGESLMDIIGKTSHNKKEYDYTNQG
jgi:hypothetical protein